MPSEDTIRALAKVLGADPTDLILLAGKVSKASSPDVAAVLLRASKGEELTEEVLMALMKKVKEEKGKGK